MKKIITLTVAVLVTCFFCANAQDKGFYIKPTGSYFMKVTPVEFPAIGGEPARDLVNENGSFKSETALTGSFGEGWRAGIIGGYRFSDVVGLEVGFNYFQSSNQDMMRRREIGGGFTYLDLYTVGKVKAMDIAPALVLHIPTNSTFKPYTKVGFILPVGGYLQINTSINDQTNTFGAQLGFPFPAQSLVLNREEHIKANPTIGFQSALGFDYSIGSGINLFAEIEYRNISVGGKDKELKKFEGNAILVTPGGNVSQEITMSMAPEAIKHVNYHKTIDNSMNVEGTQNYNSTQPSDDLRSYINIGGLGFNIGVKIPLGSK